MEMFIKVNVSFVVQESSSNLEDVQENVDQINFMWGKLVLVPLDTNEKELVV